MLQRVTWGPMQLRKGSDVITSGTCHLRCGLKIYHKVSLLSSCQSANRSALHNSRTDLYFLILDHEWCVSNRECGFQTTILFLAVVKRLLLHWTFSLLHFKCLRWCSESKQIAACTNFLCTDLKELSCSKQHWQNPPTDKEPDALWGERGGKKD